MRMILPRSFVVTAANAIVTNNGASIVGAGGGRTIFFGTSTAGNAIITNNGGTVIGALGGYIAR